jgi:DNA-binding IclR family transcriptional regulator
MYRANQIQKVLTLLAKNAESKVQPDLVDSVRIAKELSLTVSETKQILKTMHEMGVIESNMETEYSLITRVGLNSLGSRSL